jgi:tryptophanyl-tRNA synthetase
LSNVFSLSYLIFNRATKVPVGEDQIQNLQLAHSLARTFNRQYGETFPISEVLVQRKYY